MFRLGEGMVEVSFIENKKEAQKGGVFGGSSDQVPV